MSHKNCVFCKIVHFEIPSSKVFENEKVLAFLDITPVNKGHVLLIPKEHHQMMTDTPDELVAEVFIQAKKMMKNIKKAFDADFVTVSVVGIEVPHFHVHLIPRYQDDGLANWWPTQEYDEGEIENYRKKLIQIS